MLANRSLASCHEHDMESTTDAATLFSPRSDPALVSQVACSTPVAPVPVLQGYLRECHAPAPRWSVALPGGQGRKTCTIDLSY
jgi:hypothetical protein